MHTIVHVAWGVSKHVAFGYLVYSILRHGRGLSPTDEATAVLLVGTVFPDLVDKLLVVAGVVGYGRSFAHSLLTAAGILLLADVLARRADRRDLHTAFGVGYLSHVAVDMYGPLLTGSQAMDTAFLFWPLVVEYPLGVPTPELPVSRFLVFSAVTASAVGLWLYDGLPLAPAAARRWVGRLKT